MLNIAKKTVQNAKELSREAKASTHINVVGHYDDSTLIDADGKLIKLFELDGLDFVTQHQLMLDIYKQRRNSLLKSLNSNYALYSWIVRSRAVLYPSGEFTQPFAKALNTKYKENILGANLYHNRIYLALISKAPEGKINKLNHWLKSLNHKIDQKSYEHYMTKIYQDLQQVANKFTSALQGYGIRALGVCDGTNNQGEHKISESLSFIGQLVNLDYTNVPLLKQNAASYLPRKRLFFNGRSGTIEIRAADNSKRFAAVLSIKDYTNGTYAGLLDSVQRQSAEMIITQSFRFFDSHATKTALKNQQKDFQQINDESVSQTEQLSDSLDEAASGTAGFGLHHLSILCLSDSQQELNRTVADIVAEFSKFDMVCVREDIATVILQHFNGQ